MVLVEGHRERGSIRITPVFPKVAIGTWFHPGDQDLPWTVGTELPRVTLPYGAVTHGCAQEEPLVEVVRQCQQALLAGLHSIRVPLRLRLHSRPARHRPEKRRVGEQWVGSCESQWVPEHLRKKA